MGRKLLFLEIFWFIGELFGVQIDFINFKLIARQLISKELPLLKCSDLGQKAIQIMESFRISHLPMVRNNEYLGLIADKDIYDLDMEMCQLGDKMVTVLAPFVRADQHIFEVIQKILEFKITVLPVLEMNNDYLGAITINDLTEHFIKLVSVNQPGAVIVLELSPTDYSLSQIAQIVESNNAKIISLYTSNPENSSELDVTLKVNVTEISSVIQTFVRYDYNIKAVYMDNSSIKDMYTERYEQFIKYLSI